MTKRPTRQAMRCTSSLQVLQLSGGAVTQVTTWHDARVEAPVWKPDSDVLVFNARVDDRMAVYIADMTLGSVQAIPIEFDLLCDVACGIA